MINITDIRGVSTTIFPRDIRYINASHNEDKSMKILLHYSDSAEVTIVVTEKEANNFYTQLAIEYDTTFSRIELRTKKGCEYLVSTTNIKYIFFGDVIAKPENKIIDGTRKVTIHREDGSVDEFDNITTESCDKLKNVFLGVISLYV